MGDHVELHVRLAEPPFQRFDLAEQKAGTFNVVAAPIVREYEKSIGCVCTRRRFPIGLTIAGTFFERVDEAFVDLGFRKESEKLYAADDVAGYQIVPVSRKDRRDRKPQ